MNPNSSEHGELHLPAPVPETRAPEQAAEVTKQVPEVAPMTAEQGASQNASSLPALPVTPLLSPPQPAATQPADDVTSTTTTGVSNTADNVDLIEKEWVNKAKQIVERTREDPHQQSTEIGLVKADYMKQRYNKTIKLSE